MPVKHEIYVGCAGWSIPREHARHFPAEGSHLERYAARLPAVEINSSFYRLHKLDTYARWARSTPPAFRFSVKIPRQITHTGRLADLSLLDEFLIGASELGEKLGALLVQLPPSLPFRPETAQAFFAALRERYEGGAVCEPRHRTWFTPPAETLLAGLRISRAAADPAVVPQAGEPGGWSGLVYYRLHGSPQMYTSPYSPEQLSALAVKLQQAAEAGPAWYIFDNTALGAATENALALWEQFQTR
jgi:uncharacterized protein YecE (DUF72 family)